MTATDELDKAVRWQCRRGMLELDLVLAEFLDRHLARLSAADKKSLLALLEWPDNDLWDLILGRTQSDNRQFETVVALLRAT
ncbi:MAG: succinate dehydrogenase assembly factor 2 [Sulfuricellaceae bacterium]|jgi:antitoxin CptB